MSASVPQALPGRPASVDLANVNSWLLAAAFFCIPLPVAPGYVLSAAMLAVWIVDGRISGKLRALSVEPLVWIFVGYHLTLLASMLWTDDTEWGWRMVRRQNFFLLFALYLSVARREHFGRYVGAFLLSIAMCEALALYNWMQLHWFPLWPEGIRVEKGESDTAPFVDRIMYAPMLALAGYLAAHRVCFDTLTVRRRLMYAALLAVTMLNLVIAGGRSGVVGFLVLLCLLVFQRYGQRPARAAAISILLVSGIMIAAYSGSDHFAERVDQAIDEVQHFEQRNGSSVGIRIVLAMNSWHMYAGHPWFGVGIGDFPSEYERINAERTPGWGVGWNPHNQYLYALTAAGVAGGVMLALVLLAPLLRRAPLDDDRRRIRRAVPLLLIVICLFESYLLRSNVSMMYVLFTAACWCGVSSSRRCSAS